MDELKRLKKILNLELILIIIFIVVMGSSVFWFFFQLVLRLDGLITQCEEAQAVMGMATIIAKEAEYEAYFRLTGEEEYAEKFLTLGPEFTKKWISAREKIILFKPEEAFFYKINNLRDFHNEYRKIISEIFSRVREGTLEDTETLIEQQKKLLVQMEKIVDDWDQLNRTNLLSIYKEAIRFKNIVLGIIFGITFLMTISWILISRKMFAPMILDIIQILKRNQTALEEAKTVLEIRVAARTRELRELVEQQEEIIKERTKEIQERMEELEKFQKLAVGRELKMIELKKEIKKLREQLKLKSYGRKNYKGISSKINGN